MYFPEKPNAVLSGPLSHSYPRDALLALADRLDEAGFICAASAFRAHAAGRHETVDPRIMWS